MYVLNSLNYIIEYKNKTIKLHLLYVVFKRKIKYLTKTSLYVANIFTVSIKMKE